MAPWRGSQTNVLWQNLMTKQLIKRRPGTRSTRIPNTTDHNHDKKIVKQAGRAHNAYIYNTKRPMRNLQQQLLPQGGRGGGQDVIKMGLLTGVYIVI